MFLMFSILLVWAINYTIVRAMNTREIINICVPRIIQFFPGVTEQIFRFRSNSGVSAGFLPHRMLGQETKRLDLCSST